MYTSSKLNSVCGISVDKEIECWGQINSIGNSAVDLKYNNNNIDNVFSNINIRQTTYIPNVIKQNTMVVTMGVDYFCIVSSKG